MDLFGINEFEDYDNHKKENYKIKNDKINRTENEYDEINSNEDEYDDFI
jgi:hypothetical protein